MKKWRILDTGIRSAAENMALDESLLRIKSNHASPNTIRFLQFNPDAVLVGFHQSVEMEVRQSYCNQTGIDINRRITGGGAILFQEAHLGWELICSKTGFPSTLKHQKLFERLSIPVIQCLQTYGIHARYRPRNDIEVGNRKISGTGGIELQGAFLFQGTLLTELDIPRMLKSLRIPVEKLKEKEISVIRDRITTVRQELGRLPPIQEIKTRLIEAFSDEFGIEPETADLLPEEIQLFHERLPYFKSQEWIHKVRLPAGKLNTLRSTYKSQGGIIRVAIVIDSRSQSIQSALITGDFFCYSGHVLNDLEAALKGCRIDMSAISAIIQSFFLTKQPIIPGVNAEDFTRAMAEALQKIDISHHDFTLEESNHIFTVNGRFSEIIQKSICALLLPYCAQKSDCHLRCLGDCNLCGECSVGTGYALAQDKHMEVYCITSFENLMTILSKLRDRNAEAYIGCCCESFYIKHRDDFEAAGIPGILIDITDTTCYDLDKLLNAYHGQFHGQTQINISLLKKVLYAAL